MKTNLLSARSRRPLSSALQVFTQHSARALLCGAFICAAAGTAAAAELPAAGESAALPSTASAAVSAPLTLKQVRAVGQLPGDLKDLPELQSFYGREISSKLLDEVLLQLNRYYHDQGYRHAKAFLPEQVVKADGLLQVYIADSLLEEVSIAQEPEALLRPSAVRRLFAGFDEAVGTPINEAELESQILKLADLGIFSLTGSFAPGSAPLEQVLNLSARAEDRVKFTAFADNHGTDAAGRYRFGGQLTWLNPTRNADVLSLFYARSSHRQNNYGLSYEIPVNSHPTVVGAAICLTDYELGREYADLGAEGKSWEASLYVKEPLVRTPLSALKLNAGYRYRDLTDEFTEFDLKFKQHSHALWAGLDGVLHEPDWSVYGGLRLTVGKLKNDDDFSLYDESVYKILNLNGRLTRRLNDLLSLNAELEVQLTPDDVDSSEEFIAGGALGVSGYDSNVLSGDSGALLKLYPEFRPFKSFDFAIRPNVKAAAVKDEDCPRDTLVSAGLELAASCKGFSASLSVDAALGDQPYDDLDDGKVWFALSYTC